MNSDYLSNPRRRRSRQGTSGGEQAGPTRSYASSPIVVTTPASACCSTTATVDDRAESDDGAGTLNTPYLAAAGIDHKAVDEVTISHFHVDHCRPVARQQQARLPNAEVQVPAEQSKDWMDDGG